MLRAILVLSTIAAFAAPAYAAEYYIVHGGDRHCRVVEQIPEQHFRVGPSSYRDRNEAERQLKVVCRDNGYYRDEIRREDRR